VWFIRCDADISRLRLQKSEVAEVKWVSPDELKCMIEQRQYHNYGKEYFKAVFDYAEKMYRSFTDGNKELI
jgi:isopentenyldiphosphate isomerase